MDNTQIVTCPYEQEIEEVMSNFDHEIDSDIAQRLKEEPVFARYAGWNFNGRVWFNKVEETYYCEVWRYHAHVDTVCGSLEGIMEEVSDAYGWG